MLDIELKTLSACPLCGLEKRTKLCRIEGSEVFKCLDCGLSYLDPCLDSKSMATAYQSSETLKQLNEFHDGYYEYGDLSQDSKTLRDFEACLKLLEKHTPQSERKILEVGFGNGLFLALAKRHGWKIDGIDTSEKNVERAKEKFSLELQHGFFEDMEIRKDEYGTVAMLDVIEHQENPNLFLKKAYSMLRPGGLVILATPNASSLLHRLARVFYFLSGGLFRVGIKKVYLLEHVTYYDRKTLSKLLRQNQFEPVESFQTSTDLAKFRLKSLERSAAELVLLLGRIFRLQNRIVMIGRKTS